MAAPAPDAQVEAAPLYLEPLVPVAAGTLLAQGAEARVWKGTFLGRPAVFKQRFSKGYRHPVLDARLTRDRVKQEARAMARARRLGVPAPAPWHVDAAASTITMEAVAGRTLRDALRGGELGEEATARAMTAVGAAVAALHDGGLVHGDLTTSNLILRDGDDSLVVIDFGLATHSTSAEDRGVDLYVLERALMSAHAGAGEAAFGQVVAAYRQHSRHWAETLRKFADVRLRGRKRSMVG